MRLLLDTHVFLWWILDDSRLSAKARALIAEGENDVIFSAASAWEIAIKAALGRIETPADFAPYMSEQVSLNGFRVLPVELSHALRVQALAPHHRDPFDRLLVAQAQVEALPILSRDGAFAPYDVEVIW